MCIRDRLLLGRADRGDLRRGEHRGGHVAVVEGLQGLRVGEVVCDDPGLMVGHVLELVRRADVAERPHAGRVGAAMPVDDDPPVGVHPHPGHVLSLIHI